MGTAWQRLYGIYGGIVSLAEFVTEHDEAISYDLLTQTGYELKDVGKSLTWDSLASFLINTEPDTALGRELDPDTALWASTLKTNGLLADIYDMLAQINANLVAIGSHKPAKAPKPYPRPGMNEKRENVKHYGRDAVSKVDFVAWLDRKRKEHNERND